MTRTHVGVFAVLVAVLCGTPAITNGTTSKEKAAEREWQREFKISERKMVSTGRNPYFILEPGYQHVYENGDEKLVITVLDMTEKVGDVETRVVEEREWEDGKLAEVSLNYFAMDEKTKDVFYFGEGVDDYKDGKVSGHGGAWRADKPDCKPGLIMPGTPTVGMKYYQEIAPGVAMDRAEVLSVSAKITTPAGTFEGCLQTREGSGLKKWEKEIKNYAPGVGLLNDGTLLLVKHGFVGK